MFHVSAVKCVIDSQLKSLGSHLLQVFLRSVLCRIKAFLQAWTQERTFCSQKEYQQYSLQAWTQGRTFRSWTRYQQCKA